MSAQNTRTATAKTGRAQFGRAMTFSAKGTSKNRKYQDILREAARVDGHTNHIAEVRKPAILWGCDPVAIEDEIVRREAIARAASFGKDIRVRKDGHRLEGLVLSWPDPSEKMSDPAILRAYLAWEKDAVRWALQDVRRRGLDPLSVVRHVDESHWHFHVLSIPNPDTEPLMDVRAHHFGGSAQKAAEAQAKADGLARSKFRSVDAYEQGCAEWQTRLYTELSSKHGLDRDAGKAEPRRNRRDAVKRRNALAEADRLLAEIGDELVRTREMVEAKKRGAAKVIADEKARVKALLDAELRRAAEAKAHRLAMETAMVELERGRIVGAVIGRDGSKQFAFHPSVDPIGKRDILARLNAAFEEAWEWVKQMARAMMLLAAAEEAGVALDAIKRVRAAQGNRDSLVTAAQRARTKQVALQSVAKRS